jgi:hypothetical protein
MDSTPSTQEERGQRFTDLITVLHDSVAIAKNPRSAEHDKREQWFSDAEEISEWRAAAPAADIRSVAKVDHVSDTSEQRYEIVVHQDESVDVTGAYQIVGWHDPNESAQR